MLLTVRHWQDRAEHARVHARFMGDEEAARLLRAVADLYDQIAERARLAGR